MAPLTDSSCDPSDSNSDQQAPQVGVGTPVEISSSTLSGVADPIVPIFIHY
jgi:hypothetical protein